MQLLAQLANLRFDEHLAIVAVRIVAVIILVMLVGRKERLEGNELRDDRATGGYGVHLLLVRLDGRGLLLVVMVKDDRPIWVPKSGPWLFGVVGS